MWLRIVILFLGIGIPSTVLAAVPTTRPATTRPATTQQSRVVGTIYGKPVTAAEIGLAGPIDVNESFDARDRVRWELMGRIQHAFGSPILRRFIDQRKLDPTEEELELMRRRMKKSRQERVSRLQAEVATLKKELASEDLPAERQAMLEQELALDERILPDLQEPSEPPMDLLKGLIVNWKLQRALYQTYGGRVVFQQMGLEALDATRQLFETAEQAGDLTFDDPGVRFLFYYYYTHTRHTAGDATALERPPWGEPEQ